MCVQGVPQRERMAEDYMDGVSGCIRYGILLVDVYGRATEADTWTLYIHDGTYTFLNYPTQFYVIENLRSTATSQKIG